MDVLHRARKAKHRSQSTVRGIGAPGSFDAGVQLAMVVSGMHVQQMTHTSWPYAPWNTRIARVVARQSVSPLSSHSRLDSSVYSRLICNVTITCI